MKFLLVFTLILAGCAGGPVTYPTVTPCHKKFAGRAYNKPYEIRGALYVPQTYYEYKETGVASYYGGRDVFHGRPTSNGETFNKNQITAAHKTLPIPCMVRIVNLDNNRSLLVKVNDRGPFIDDRIVDVSEKVAKLLGFHQKGLARVKVETDVVSSLRLAESMAKGNKRNSSPLRLAQIKTNQPQITKEVLSQKSSIFLDAGGFYQPAKAKRFASHLKAKGAPVVVKNIKHADSSFFRVLVGPYTSVQAAQRAIKQFKGTPLKAAKVIRL